MKSMNILKTIKKFNRMIMVEQTLFALPFAYMGMLLAAFHRGLNLNQFIWISLALISARTAGMCFNRAIDSEIDSKNKRTENRIIPTGEFSRKSVFILGIVFSILLIISSKMLNPLCFYLSFLAVFMLFTYSFFKRFSATSHYYLGLVEAAAPIGGYLAIDGKFSAEALISGGVILFWIGGFDVIYAVSDMDFDKRENLHSIPSKLGIKKSMVISIASYLISFGLLIFLGWALSPLYYFRFSLIIILIIYIWQQLIGWEIILKKNMKMVFYLNRYISPLLLAGLVVDYLSKVK